MVIFFSVKGLFLPKDYPVSSDLYILVQPVSFRLSSYWLIQVIGLPEHAFLSHKTSVVCSAEFLLNPATCKYTVLKGLGFSKEVRHTAFIYSWILLP